MKLYNIVLTGGPAAGKTTILSEIQKKFNSDKTKVIIVPEVASELCSWNLPILTGEKALIYQDNVFKKQKLNEIVVNSLASELDCENVLIIYDRATLDGKAYISSEDFTKLLQMNNDSELKILDFYDLVINLQSSANLEGKYQKETNPARIEDQETARVLGNKTLDAWLMHRNLYNVTATSDIKDKIEEVNKIINDFAILRREEIDRYLIDYRVGQELITKFNARSIAEDDYYIRSPYYCKCRINMRNDGKDTSYIGKIYTPCRDIDVLNDEKVIDKDLLNYYISQSMLTSKVQKQVYRFTYENEVFELVFVNNICFLRALTKKDIKDIKLPCEIDYQRRINPTDYYNIVFNQDPYRKLL